jgi:ADP-dependent NAD(P)H-hydrate dehydratase
VKQAKPLDKTALRAHPLRTVVDGEKDSKGAILIVAGSRQVPGAGLLVGLGAMRAGAGRLRIATAESVAGHFAVGMPEAMVIGLPETKDGGLAAASVKVIAEQAKAIDAVVAGPGMERGEVCGRIAEALLESDARIALDAALLYSLEPLPPHRRETPPVLLPHSKELASLLECDEQEVEREPVRSGVRAAELYRSVVLVKGVTSHVVTPDGDAWTYAGGAPGLGVSGSGDVLAGIVGGLLARGTEPLNALLWAAWLHGEAGARLAKTVGPIGFLAREIADQVPALLPR